MESTVFDREENIMGGNLLLTNIFYFSAQCLLKLFLFLSPPPIKKKEKTGNQIRDCFM